MASVSNVSRVTVCGAAQGVTGSCYLLEAAGHRLLVDCGVFQGEGGAEARNRMEFPFTPSTLDAVVLTHGHLDHVGRLPLLAQRGFRGPVIGHPATLDIARLVMEDTARIGLYANEKALYAERDVQDVMHAQRALRYNTLSTVGPFSIELFDAGHILGSSHVRVAWKSGGTERAILFSGDIGTHGAPLLREPNTRWDATRHAVDAVITESTYGNKVHPERDLARKKFRDTVLHAVKDGGKVLIPAFAIGRTQEILYDLNVLVESGQLPRIPVIVDGPMGLEATRIYERHKDCYDEQTLAQIHRGDQPLEFRDLYAARKRGESERVHDIDGAAIIIAGSGMCSGGRIVEHLSHYLPSPTTDVLFVGYQAEGTLGRAIQAGNNSVVIGGQRVSVRAQISTIHGFSAHADREQLASWLSRVPIKRTGKVIVTHGEREIANTYAQHVRDRFSLRAVVPAYTDTVEIEA